MELYVLDDTFRRIKVIDRYESLIWTDRHSGLGDFQLDIVSTSATRSILVNDTKLGVNTSLSVMVIETIVDATDDDGRKILTITGRSLEAILLQRVARKSLSPQNIVKGSATISIANPGVINFVGHGFVTGDSFYMTTTGSLPSMITANTLYYAIVVDANNFNVATTLVNATAGTKIDTTGGIQSGVHTLNKYVSNQWTITDTPGNIARFIFNQICILGVLSTSDIIPLYIAGNLFPADNIVESTTPITVAFDPTTVYDITKQILDAFNMGFRLYRGLDDQHLYYNVHTGIDRTSSQSIVRPVIFSPNLDNLSKVTELNSIASYKNVALVISLYGEQYVYATGTDSTTAGFQRRVIFVDASDIDDLPGSILDAKLLKKGQDALASNRSLFAFDGEIPQDSNYTYTVDYNLGDLIEKRNDDGIINNMRVTEHIGSSDVNGDRSYPTLASDILITPGSWLAWDSNMVWDDVPDIETWDTI